MKKILLSLGLIGLFTFYAVQERQQPAAQVSVSGSTQTSPTPTPTEVAAGGNPNIRSGQLINNNGTIYLVKPDGLYGFPNMATFNSWGYKISQVVSPNSAETSLAVVAIMQPRNQVASSPTPTPTTQVASGQYKDGTYNGSNADAFYGNLRVQAIISGGKLTDVKFLDYPQDRSTSVEVNTEAIPKLRSEAIAAQSANVDIVSGATQSTDAFRQSLQAALNQAL